MFSKHYKISKNASLDAQGFNFDDLLVPFGLLFSIKFREHLITTSQDATCRIRKPLLYNLRSPVLASKFNQSINKHLFLFETPSWTIFSPFILIFQKCSLLDPSDPVGANMARPSGTKTQPKSSQGTPPFSRSCKQLASKRSPEASKV